MPASKYDTDVDPSSNTSHALMLRLVGSNKRVLDVGCATGYLARALREQGCRVSGVEYDPAAAAEAEPALDKLVVGDLEQLDLTVELAGEQFDVVVFGDVLEHLRDPLPVLRSVRELLVPGGAVVISVPNIAHGDVRLSLLQGRFEYRSLGLLDNTHIHFFTRSTLRAFLRDAGFTAVDVQTTTADLLTTELADDARDADPRIVDALREDIDATTYQFVVRAVRDDAAQLAEDVAWQASELTKRMSAAQAEIDDLRAQVATTAEALRAAQESRESMEAQVREARRQADEAERRAAELTAELEALHGTKIMRLARYPRGAWSRLARHG
jgi:2-polyprenyl-3-methyl-5-hydroxy-6-metoxy-1,4-benzoquinol methylase